MKKHLFVCFAALIGLTACDGGGSQTSADYVQEAIEKSRQMLGQTEQIANTANQQLSTAWDDINESWLITTGILNDAGVTLIPPSSYPDVALSQNSLTLDDAYLNGPGGLNGSLDGLTLHRQPGTDPTYSLSGQFAITLGGFTFEVAPGSLFSPETPARPAEPQSNNGQATGQ